MGFFSRIFGRKKTTTGRDLHRDRLILNVGINQFIDSPENTLRGAVVDARELRAEFEARRYLGAAPLILDTDATRHRIGEILGNTCASMRPDDDLVITYSSHGAPTPHPDEPDGLVESLCCTDVISNYPGGSITAYDLARWFRLAPEGSRILLVADVCHSGPKDVGLLRSLHLHYRKARALILPDGLQTGGSVRGLAASASAIDVGWTRTALLAACRWDQTAADTYEDGAYRGALSWGLLRALRDGVGELDPIHGSIGRRLAGRYGQSPQLFAPRRLRDWSIG